MGEYIVAGGPKVEKPTSLWYSEEPGPDRARCLMETIREIDYRQSTISSGNRRHAEIYASYIPVGFSYASPVGYSRPQVQATRNIIRSVCDTATALIGKNLPRPRIVTDGGNWDLQQKAYQLDKFLVGAYKQGKIYSAAQSAFRDSTIFGTGAYILREHTKPDWHVRAHRILIDDLIVDEQECCDEPCSPNYYLRCTVPLDKALKLYGKDDYYADELVKASGRSPTAWPNQRNVPRDHVVLVEAWHIEEGAGIHTISVNGCELFAEKWDFDWPPIIVLYWSPPISGFYGDGVAYRQYGRQRRINYLYRWVQRCQDLIAVPRVWVDATNGPLRVQISNEIGEVVGVRGNPPVFQTPQAVGQEIYKWLDQLESGGYEDEGISQMSASNQLPPGIESAPAQREYSFKEGQRFAPVSQRWEDAVAAETTTKLLALYKARYEGNNVTPSVKWSSKKLVEQIPWDEVDLDTTQYEIRVEASSLSDLSPSGRLQAAIDLSQTGWIPPEEGRRLLAHPDLERTDKKYNASIEYAEWASAQIIKGRYVPPCEYGDLDLQQSTVKADLQNAEMGGAPKAILELQRQFIRACEDLINPPKPPAMPGMGPGSPDGMMPAGIQAAPAPAMSLASAQGLGPMAGTGTSHQNM